MTELAAPQISSLMEALPGIAAVLRSPVASAMVSLVRSGVGLEEFRIADADELLKFGIRRNLITQEEVDRLLDEVRDAAERRPKPPAKPAVAEKAKPVAAEPAVEPVKAPAAKAAIPAKAAAVRPAAAAKPVAAKVVAPKGKAASAKAPVKAAGKAPAKPASKAPAKPAPKAPAKPVKGKTTAKPVAKAKAPARPVKKRR